VIEPADAERLGRVLAATETPLRLMAAIMAHGRHPERFPAEKLAALAPVAETAERELQDARAALAKLLPDVPSARTSSAFDLGALAELDAGRAEALRLAECLRDLLPLALELDTKRGRVLSEKVPLGPGESRSVDVAEILSDLCARLEREAGVGVGKGLE
jgi:hypothetical protein